eukprot:411996-Prymnesium_polylepis.1
MHGRLQRCTAVCGGVRRCAAVCVGVRRCAAVCGGVRRCAAVCGVVCGCLQRCVARPGAVRRVGVAAQWDAVRANVVVSIPAVRRWTWAAAHHRAHYATRCGRRLRGSGRAAPALVRRSPGIRSRRRAGVHRAHRTGRVCARGRAAVAFALHACSSRSARASPHLVVCSLRVDRVDLPEDLLDAQRLLRHVEPRVRHPPLQRRHQPRSRRIHRSPQRATLRSRRLLRSTRLGLSGGEREPAGAVEARDATHEVRMCCAQRQRRVTADRVAGDERSLGAVAAGDIPEEGGALLRPDGGIVLDDGLGGEAEAEQVDRVHAVARRRQHVDVPPPVEAGRPEAMDEEDGLCRRLWPDGNVVDGVLPPVKRVVRPAVRLAYVKGRPTGQSCTPRCRARRFESRG